MRENADNKTRICIGKELSLQEKMNESTVTLMPPEHLFHYWRRKSDLLRWDCLFMLPPWLNAWWYSFGSGHMHYICLVSIKDIPVGIAPLALNGNTAFIIGDRDLCDYGDFIISPGQEELFFRKLFTHLRQEGITRLDSGLVRGGSPILSVVTGNSEAFECDISCIPADVVYRLKLPKRWDGFLRLLSRRQRHELRRKLRRLDDAGRYRVRFIEGGSDFSEALDTFITLFRMNRRDKAEFLNEDKESFFRVLAACMADAGLLRFVLLELDGCPAASVMCFEYDSVLYLYNSGYNERYAALSAGLLCKVFSIRDGIQRGTDYFDFLKGDEAYKNQLGGKPERLFDVSVILK